MYKVKYKKHDPYNEECTCNRCYNMGLTDIE